MRNAFHGTFQSALASKLPHHAPGKTNCAPLVEVICLRLNKKLWAKPGLSSVF